jgi:hypothetical protein
MRLIMSADEAESETAPTYDDVNGRAPGALLAEGTLYMLALGSADAARHVGDILGLSERELAAKIEHTKAQLTEHYGCAFDA